ncbi:MAG: hypothetical protein R3B72_11895 [Polyangiaceae bacterium]
MRALATRAALAMLLTGCAFGDGDPYGIVSGTLEAGYELHEDRDAGDGFQRLVSELSLRLDRAELRIADVELIATQAATVASSVTFDPANPPDGYSLCHNGHCHRDDGALVDYADIQAELAGTTATSQTVVTLRAAPIDLLVSEPVSLDCGDGCVVGQVDVSRLRLEATLLEVAGVIRDDRPIPAFDGDKPFHATLALGAIDETQPAVGRLEHAVTLPFDDEEPPVVALALSLRASAALFDGIDPDVVAAATEELTFHDDPSIRSAFAELELELTMTRTDP